MLSISHKMEELRVHNIAVINIANVNVRLLKYNSIEVITEKLMIEYTPSIVQPLQEFIINPLTAPSIFKQKFHICLFWKLFTNIENKIKFGRYLLTLVSIV